MDFRTLTALPWFWWGLYLLMMNLVGYCLMGIDKYKACRGRWRIRERTLMGVAALGGALGSWIGMGTFHHKTRHSKFVWGVPACLTAHLAVIAYFVWLRR